MNCVLCHNGVTENGFVTVTLEKNNSIILLKNVPAEICNNCGHYYLSKEMTKEVLQKGNEAISKGAELEIVNLKVA
jgi:YgiT-type zinc finger domain-containing protein